jgi:hypothetical protein
MYSLWLIHRSFLPQWLAIVTVKCKSLSSKVYDTITQLPGSHLVADYMASTSFPLGIEIHWSHLSLLEFNSFPSETYYCHPKTYWCDSHTKLLLIKRLFLQKRKYDNEVMNIGLVFSLSTLSLRNSQPDTRVGGCGILSPGRAANQFSQWRGNVLQGGMYLKLMVPCLI